MKEINLHRVKKGDELSSQDYEQEITVKQKNKKTLLLKNNIPLTGIMKRKETLPRIIYPSIMEVCGIIMKFPDDTYPVFMEDCVNKKLDDINRKDLNE